MSFDRSYLNTLRLDGKYSEAHEYCLKHISDSDALAEIAFDYHNGLAVSMDHAKGAYYDHLAANGGSAQGIYQLGKSYLYLYSHNEEQVDLYDHARALIKRAAGLGWIDAKLQLGQMYLQHIETGSKVYNKNVPAAAHLFKECSEAGDLRGTIYLAICTAAGCHARQFSDHARYLHNRIFRSSNDRLSTFARSKRSFKTPIHPSGRWKRRRAAAEDITSIQILCFLVEDNRGDRRVALEMRDRISRMIECRVPKGSC